MDHGMFILLNKTAIKCSKLTHLKQPNSLLLPKTQNIRTDQPAATSRANNINQNLRLTLQPTALDYTRGVPKWTVVLKARERVILEDNGRDDKSRTVKEGQ